MSTNSQSFFIEAVPYPRMHLQSHALNQAHRNYSVNSCWLKENINRPTHLDTLVFVLHSDVPPHGWLLHPSVCMERGQVHCLRLQLGNTNCRLSAFINCWVNQALQIVPTHATTKAFLEHQENRFKLKQKRSLAAFWTLDSCHIFQSIWVQVRSDGRVLAQASAMHGLSTAGRCQRERWCAFSLSPPTILRDCYHTHLSIGKLRLGWEEYTYLPRVTELEEIELRCRSAHHCTSHT